MPREALAQQARNIKIDCNPKSVYGITQYLVDS